MTEAEALERVRALKADRDARFSEEEIREAFRATADVLAQHGMLDGANFIELRAEDVLAMLRSGRMRVTPPPSEAPTDT